MTFEFGPVVRARVRIDGTEMTSQLAIPRWGTWDDVPVEAQRHIVRQLKAKFYPSTLCVWCSDLSIDEAYEPCLTCPTVRFTLWDGKRETRLPDPAPRPVPKRENPYFLKLVATAEVGSGRYATGLMVPAGDWHCSTADRKLLTMNYLREELLERSGCRTADIRTFVWDGEREIPFPADQLCGPADPAG
ncbi:hypothetical protein ACFWRZ_08810 [Streptomyces rubiginosohelvolus]|uniref:hypothetical protein n=1 Tax=Streptomyces rubiginosohelvolus TaxID=67362 RepID=UPI00364A9CED